jgi:hypothetical protein
MVSRDRNYGHPKVDLDSGASQRTNFSGSGSYHADRVVRLLEGPPEIQLSEYEVDSIIGDYIARHPAPERSFRR